MLSHDSGYSTINPQLSRHKVLILHVIMLLNNCRSK